uniref:Transposase n=1 Tax=Rodentolepis nana TaxID=102285 RepID=A0A0R3T8V0_RODNA
MTLNKRVAECYFPVCVKMEVNRDSLINIRHYRAEIQNKTDRIGIMNNENILFKRESMMQYIRKDQRRKHTFFDAA